MKYSNRNLFLLQTELIDAKVEMATSNAIGQVVDEIRSLRGEMNTRFSSIENRLYVVENRLGVVEKELGSFNELKKELRSKLIDYSSKGVWILSVGLASVFFSLLLNYVHHLLH